MFVENGLTGILGQLFVRNLTGSEGKAVLRANLFEEHPCTQRRFLIRQMKIVSDA